MRRLDITRNKRGSKPTWKFTEKTGKLTRRKGAGGVDWYRYQKRILLPLLLPFAQDCKRERPATIVQEDKAAAHSSHFQQAVYDAADVARLTWPGNSPDLNMIKPCWAHMKWRTTKKGAPTLRATAEKAWTQAWKDLEQEKIQSWIERIPRHIQKVIELKGGNKYKEGQ